MPRAKALANFSSLLLEGLRTIEVPRPDEKNARGGRLDKGIFEILLFKSLVVVPCDNPKPVSKFREVTIAEGQALKKWEDLGK